MDETIEQLNKTVFTINNIPLPVEDDEDIMYFNPHTKFNMQLGNGIPAYTRRYISYKGDLYLTNYRLIYKPCNETKYFRSFSAPISFLKFDEDECMVSFISENCYLIPIYLSFEDSDPQVFYKSLQEAIEKWELRNVAKNKDVYKNDEPPYYSDVCD